MTGRRGPAARSRDPRSAPAGGPALSGSPGRLPALALALVLAAGTVPLASGRTLHVRAGARGRPDGSPARPYPSLASALRRADPDDVIRLAAGRYLPPRGSSGETLRFPVLLEGGWSPDFQARDPWDRHATVFADPPPDRAPDRADGPRLAVEIEDSRPAPAPPPRIALDGILFDGGTRARYPEPGETRIHRGSDPVTGASTLEGPALRVRSRVALHLGLHAVGVVDHPSAEAALDLSLAPGSRIDLVDSVIAHVSGAGIRIRIQGRGSPPPRLRLDATRILCIERVDPTFPGGGHGILALDPIDLHLRRSELLLVDGYGLEAPRGLRSLSVRELRVEGCLLGPARVGRAPAPLGSPSPGRHASLALPPAWSQVFASRPAADRNFAPDDLDRIEARQPERLRLLGLSAAGPASLAWHPRLGLAALTALAPPVRPRRGGPDRTDPPPPTLR